MGCAESQLLQSCKDGDSKKALNLLEQNPNMKIDTADEHGWTPFLWAVWHNLDDVAIKLLERGANFCQEGLDGNTALLLTFHNCNESLAMTILNRYVDDRNFSFLTENPCDRLTLYAETIPFDAFRP